MTNSKHSRKDFLKRIGLTAGIAAVAPLVSASNMNYLNDKELNSEQKEFLSTYEQWLGEFHGFVKAQKNDVASPTNNKRLMELSAQAADWKKQLEIHMMDDRFARSLTRITQKITNDIA